MTFLWQCSKISSVKNDEDESDLDSTAWTVEIHVELNDVYIHASNDILY